MSRADARYNPVVKTSGHNTEEAETGTTNERTLRSSGDSSTALDMLQNEPIDTRVVSDDTLAMMAFMDEPITIRIATSTDKNAEQVFEMNINGRMEFFRRGETKTIKRHFVDRLARMKQTIYTQTEVINKEGIKDIVNIPHTALKYDFAVVRDDNPRGADWLAHVQMEPG